LVQLRHSSGAGLAFVLGLALALWTASGYVGAFGRGMNRIYQIDEGRPIWKLRPVMLLVTLITVVLAALVALGLVVTGPVARAVGDAIGAGSTLRSIPEIGGRSSPRTASLMRRLNRSAICPESCRLESMSSRFACTIRTTMPEWPNWW